MSFDFTRDLLAKLGGHSAVDEINSFCKTALKTLDDISKKNNTFTLMQFKKFMPIFYSNNSNREDEKYKKLVEEFMDRKIDFFEMIYVVDNNDPNLVLFRLPRLFRRPKDTAERSRNDRIGLNAYVNKTSSQIPRDSSAAWGVLYRVLDKKFNVDGIEIEEAQKEFMDCIKSIRDFIQNGPPKEIEETKINEQDSTEWEVPDDN